MNSMGYSKASNIRVVRLVMQETGTYNPQFARPYSTQVDGHVIDTLVNRVMDSTNKRVDSGTLSGLTGSFLSPTASPESQIGIVNGWNEKRIKFLLELQVEYNVLGMSTTQYVQGYTSYSGISHAGSIDPQMDFYINSVIHTRKQRITTPMGVQTMETLTENSHVISSHKSQDMYVPGQQRIMRPQDVFTSISMSHMPGTFEEPGSSAGLGGYYDARVVLKEEAVKSRRSNGLAGTFASSILDANSVATSLADFGQDQDAMLEAARKEVLEMPAAVDPFLAAMTNISRSIVSNRFRMSDLRILDPNVDNVTNYVIPGPTQMAQMHQTGMTAEWKGSDKLTHAACILSNAVPSLMMDLMINSVVFKSTNNSVMGQPITAIVNGKSFTNMDLSRNFELFAHRFEREIVNDLTFGNNIPYMLEMTVDLLGETWLRISMDGSPFYDYVTPSYCDNLFIPVITTEPDTVQRMANDFEQLNQGIREAMGNHYDRQTTQISTQV